MESTSTAPSDQYRRSVLGVPVDACRDVQAAAIGLHARGGGQIVTLNAEMTMAARESPMLGDAIAAADLVIPDGIGVVWALRRQGVVVTRSPGIELAGSLLAYAEAHDWKVALVGATPQVMDRLRQILKQDLPPEHPPAQEPSRGHESSDQAPPTHHWLGHHGGYGDEPQEPPPPHFPPP